jgi:3-phosphoshikimate 1-carboxyvinyltransferase
MICAALADGETIIDCPENSEDIDATARCLKALKLPPKGGEPIILDVGESGSTLRFLLPVGGALGKTVMFKMSGRLPSRPIDDLRDTMTAHGCTISGSLKCEGQLKSGEYSLPGNVSSQYVSGLLFALPLLVGDSIIHVNGNLESRPYVDMTLDALRIFGVKVFEEGPRFIVPGGQKYHSPGSLGVEGDWSNAAFWLAAGVNVTGLDPNSKQGDKAIVELLKRIPGDIDVSNTPDLVPVLAAVASVAAGKTTIYNAGRLRIKESDRLKTVATSLKSLGADITKTEDGLVIIGKSSLPGGETESYGDHRIAMMASIVRCTGPVVIHGAEAVNKSYPRFFEDFTSLGGVCEIV